MRQVFWQVKKWSYIFSRSLASTIGFNIVFTDVEATLTQLSDKLISTLFQCRIPTLCNIEKLTSDFVSFSTSDQRYFNVDPQSWNNVDPTLKCWLGLGQGYPNTVLQSKLSYVRTSYFRLRCGSSTNERKFFLIWNNLSSEFR